MTNERERALAHAIRGFIAPYAELENDFLDEIARSKPGDCHIINGRFTLTAHVAASILACRNALK